MTIFDWLLSPTGVDVQHAVIILLLAVASYFSYLAHRQSERNEQLLNGHLEQHMLTELLDEKSDVDDPPAAPPSAPTP